MTFWSKRRNDDGQRKDRSDRKLQDLALRQLNGRDRPLAILPVDRNPQPVQFIQADLLYCPRFAIGEDYRLAKKFAFGLLKLAEDCRGPVIRRWHDTPHFPRSLCSSSTLLPPNPPKSHPWPIRMFCRAAK